MVGNQGIAPQDATVPVYSSQHLRHNTNIARRMNDIKVGRDGCRTPMQWTPGHYTGFSTAKPWLPIGADYRKINVESEMADPESLLHFYRRMLAFRKANPVLTSGTWRAVKAVPDDVLAFVRELDGESLLVAINTGDRPRVLNLSREDTSTDILMDTRLRESKTANLASFALEPRQGCIFRATGLKLP